MAFQLTLALLLLDEMSSVCVAMLSGCCGAYPVTMAVTIITDIVTPNFNCSARRNDDTLSPIY
jgi:hypothetical protein